MDKIENFIATNTTTDNFSNYFELILSNKKKDITNVKDCNQEVSIIRTCLDKETFYDMMYKMMDNNYKYHQKQYKEIIVGDVYYHNHKNEEMNIYTITTNSIDNIDGKVFVTAQTKNKLSILSLPSTMNVYTENIVRKLIFRITNRIFVNFEHGTNNNQKYYKVFINYNHDKDVDLNNIISTVNNIINIIV
jgi:hypothetical protein